MTNHVNVHGVDTSKIKIGDRVTAELVVNSVENHGTVFGTVRWFYPDSITSHTPAKCPLSIGDLVCHSRPASAIWRVAAVDGDLVWLRYDDLACTLLRSEVETWEHVS